MKYRIYIPILIVILSVMTVWSFGWYLSKPTNRSIDMPNGFEAIVINNTHGSFLKSGHNEVCALLMHGVRSDRTSMIERSKFLDSRGISSLLIDLQAHGETAGELITFGIRESVDAANGVKYLRENQSCKKVVAIGQSLGGASALLGNGPIKVDALVLESVYSTIEDAVRDRLEMRLGSVGALLAPLLYLQIPIRIDASLTELRPIDVLKKVDYPIYILGGSNDLHTRISETKRMYESAKDPKSLWIVDGAVHEDLYRYSPKQYEDNISRFLDQFVQ